MVLEEKLKDVLHSLQMHLENPVECMAKFQDSVQMVLKHHTSVKESTNGIFFTHTQKKLNNNLQQLQATHASINGNRSTMMIHLRLKFLNAFIN